MSDTTDAFALVAGNDEWLYGKIQGLIPKSKTAANLGRRIRDLMSDQTRELGGTTGELLRQYLKYTDWSEVGETFWEDSEEEEGN